MPQSDGATVALRSEDLDAAERACKAVNFYYRQRGMDINAYLGPRGEILSKYSSERALKERPPTYNEKRGTNSIYGRLLKWFRRFPDEWFTHIDLHRLFRCSRDSITVALSQMKRDGRVICRDLKRNGLRGPRVEYRLNPDYVEGDEA